MFTYRPSGVGGGDCGVSARAARGRAYLSRRGIRVARVYIVFIYVTRGASTDQTARRAPRPCRSPRGSIRDPV